MESFVRTHVALQTHTCRLSIPYLILILAANAPQTCIAAGTVGNDKNSRYCYSYYFMRTTKHDVRLRR